MHSFVYPYERRLLAIIYFRVRAAISCRVNAIFDIYCGITCYKSHALHLLCEVCVGRDGGYCVSV